MQGLTDAPRAGMNPDHVRELLVGQGVTRGKGCDLVDASGAFVEDISADLRDWSITHDNTAEQHRKLRISLSRELPWGQARVRPWTRLSKRIDGQLVAAKFWGGVFVLTTPDRQHGRSLRTFDVSGHDLIHVLERRVPETFVIADPADGPAPTYLGALRDVLTAAGLMTPPLLAGARQDTVISGPMVWPVGNTRWVDIVNGLMAAIAYEDLWMSPSGVPRSQPITPVDERAPEWVFDTNDKATDLIAGGYTESLDLWAGFNQWRGVRSGMSQKPEAGNGLYEFTNQSEGLSCVDAVGLNPAPLAVLDVADQAALEAEMQRIIAADRRVEHSFTIQVDPLPIADHKDVVTLVTDGRRLKLRVASWELSPTGRGTWVLGSPAPAAGPKEVRETSATGTVTASSPLRVVFDGTTVDSPAVALADDSGAVPTYDVDSRVRITSRAPQVPIVQGKETT